MQTLSSKITSVTVYTDRAFITREAEIHIETGEHSLLFDALPDSIDADSIQVDGRGKAVLTDIQFNQAHFSEVPDEEVRELLGQQEALNDEMRTLQETVRRAQSEKSFIENIAGRLTKGTEKSVELDPEKWMKMAAFYRTKHAELDHEIHATEKSQRKIKEESDKIAQLIRQLSHRRQKTRKQIIVRVSAAEKTGITLRLCYIVMGPRWEPVYDLRANSAEKTVTLAYHALIRQSTTENWENVELKLSTARPQVSGEAPELDPWYIDVFRPMPPPSLKKRSGSFDMLAKTEMAAPAPLAEADEFAADMDKPEVTVETGATAVVFALEGVHTIHSDNKDHKAMILTHDFPSEFRYETTPKLSPFAFLKAKTVNRTDFPLLPGKTGIFLDQHFVANARMDLVSPGEEFSTSLGIDESIKIDHKQIKKYRKDEGVLSKKTVYIYDYMIKVKNNKRTDVLIVIRDQYPVSLNKDIDIILISPKYKENSETLKKDEHQRLEWVMTVKSGEELSLPVTFSVEYPQGITLTGLR